MTKTAKFPDWAKSLPWTTMKGAAEHFGVDVNLVAAIVQAESGGITFRTRYEPNYNYLSAPERWAGRLGITKETEIICQKTSYGLMQLMGATARDEGYEDYLVEMVEPAIGIYWGTKFLAGKLKKYKGHTKRAIAAYNAGSARYEKDSVLFVNQAYVDKVSKFLSELA